MPARGLTALLSASHAAVHYADFLSDFPVPEVATSTDLALSTGQTASRQGLRRYKDLCGFKAPRSLCLRAQAK